MSHQSGIQADEKLVDVISKCHQADSHIKMIEVVIDIEKETLVVGVEHCESGNEGQISFDMCYDELVLPLLGETRCCYIFLRMDKAPEWLLLCWVPNDSPVKEKMLYSSTRTTLKRTFGDSYICDELVGHIVGDINHTAYVKHVKAKGADAFSPQEAEKRAVLRSEAGEVAISDRNEGLVGTLFTISRDLDEELGAFAQRDINYVQIGLDIGTESIVKRQSLQNSLRLAEVKALTPTDCATYHLCRFYPVGDSPPLIVFIYNFLGYCLPIKERMLYSSCKNALVARINAVLEPFQGVIAHRLECENMKQELDDGYIEELAQQVEINPNEVMSHGYGENKPKARGKRRLIK